MAELEIEQFICRDDNYGVLLHDPDSDRTVSIDAPDAAAIDARLKERGWVLTDIFVTHKHFDHIEGIAPLKASYGCRAIGPTKSAAAIGTLDETVEDGATFDWAGRSVRVFATPGHTLDHVSYHLAQDHLAFVGDTLFALGCGRVFEGTPEMMWDSLLAIRALPDDTTVYCGHEYTIANARFALSIDPNNERLRSRAEKIEDQRRKDEMTLPTTIALEKATNPFLRADDPGIQAAVGMSGEAPAKVFGEIRLRKDQA